MLFKSYDLKKAAHWFALKLFKQLNVHGTLPVPLRKCAVGQPNRPFEVLRLPILSESNNVRHLAERVAVSVQFRGLDQETNGIGGFADPVHFEQLKREVAEQGHHLAVEHPVRCVLFGYAWSVGDLVTEPPRAANKRLQSFFGQERSLSEFVDIIVLFFVPSKDLIGDPLQPCERDSLCLFHEIDKKMFAVQSCV